MTSQDEKIIPYPQTISQLNIILRKYQFEQKDELKQELIEWLQSALNKERTLWSNMRQNSISALVKVQKQEQAHKNAKKRDEKYAAFRDYFYKIQKEKFLTSLKEGKQMSATGFAAWFLEHKSSNVIIPYQKQNQKNKLTQLAIANNRELKKAFAIKS